MKNQILDQVAEFELKYLVPISAFILSKDEFDHLKKRERRIALDIEREGVPLLMKKIRGKISASQNS